MQIKQIIMGLGVLAACVAAWLVLSARSEGPVESLHSPAADAPGTSDEPIIPGGRSANRPEMSPREGDRLDQPEMGGIDPRLRPGKGSVGAPSGRVGSYRDDGDQRDVDRNRNLSEYPPPAIVPPAVADRGEGVPPTPQGAGKFARDMAADGSKPPRIDPDPATVRQTQDILRAQAAAIAACFAGRSPALQLQVDLLRAAADQTEGFAAGAALAGGDELTEEVEACVLDVLEDVVLPAPPNSRGMIIPLEGL